MTGKHPVLVVEDEEESRETLRELLELEGYDVSVAGNGQEALDQMRAMDALPCVVLLDLLMPVMDGWKLIEHLRRDTRLTGIRVVVTTSAPHRAPAGLPVLEKPLSIEKVLRTVAVNC
jgi:CheY-like chemotaxis protein